MIAPMALAPNSTRLCHFPLISAVRVPVPQPGTHSVREAFAISACWTITLTMLVRQSAALRISGTVMTNQPPPVLRLTRG
jgi:hypothetical protein